MERYYTIQLSILNPFLYFQAIYEFIVDGKSVVKTQNTKPTVYENVKVWVSQGKYHPVANARIKDFKYESKSKQILKASNMAHN